ncbi:MAG: hypothetical protein HY246_05280 [Proteobacteria bacterium]|nr:hypothetical protein [Pseudomonadota bacterium]
MKRLALTIAAFAGLGLAVPAFAQTPPGQSKANQAKIDCTKPANAKHVDCVKAAENARSNKGGEIRGGARVDEVQKMNEQKRAVKETVPKKN